jgi:hypothetical protein
MCPVLNFGNVHYLLLWGDQDENLQLIKPGQTAIMAGKSV